jgi:hypothetical protein
VRAGSDVTVLARLTDADGEPIPDAAAAGVLARCGVTVAAAGAQVRRPVCARYDGKRHAFALAWPTTAADAGEVTLTVAVTSPGIPAPQTRDVPVVLVP